MNKVITSIAEECRSGNYEHADVDLDQFGKAIVEDVISYLLIQPWSECHEINTAIRIIRQRYLMR